MDSARYAQISDLFLKVVNLPQEERLAFLEQACGSDADLRSEVEALLIRDDQPAEVDTPVLDSDIQLEGPGLDEGLPDRIGSFEITGLLGRGGMGVVYKARQANPARTVALKVVDPRVASQMLRRRIEYEAQILARLQHPGIAQVFEAGTASHDGRLIPYFAMELVEGLTLLEYVAANEITLDARLQLIVRICDAVHHAHMRGVIHRDLKPANILVDRSGQPKILDFGIARATDSDLRSTTLQTNVGQLVGTVAYMSPEQVSGDPSSVDTRSDTYALGVIAFELLTGQLPYDIHSKTVADAVHTIRHVEPRLLGTIDRTLRGDVETIVAKALEKDSDRRYAAVSDFGADLQRALRHEPIVARPPSLVYQIKKFTQRNRALVGGLVSTVVLLFVAVAGTAYGLIEATQQRDAAIAARNDLQASNQSLAEETAKKGVINLFLQRMLRSANPMGDVVEGRPDVTVLEVLDRESETISFVFEGQPALESSIRSTVGGIYEGLGRHEEAEKHFRIALELHEVSSSGRESKFVARALRDLAGSIARQRRYEEAVDLLNEALVLTRRIDADERLEIALTESRLGWVMLQQEQYAEAEPVIRRALATMRSHPDAQPDNVASTINNLAGVVHKRGDLAEAEALYREAGAAFRSAFGDEHATVGIAENNIARVMYARGDLDGSKERFQSAIQILGKLLGDQHPTLGTLYNNLAAVYYDRREVDQSVEHYLQALQIYENVVGLEHAHYISTLNSCAFALFDAGSYDAAAEAWDTVADYHRNRKGAKFDQTILAEIYAAESRAKTGQVEESETVLVKTFESLRDERGLSDVITQATVRALVRFYQGQDRDDLAQEYQALLE